MLLSLDSDELQVNSSRLFIVEKQSFHKSNFVYFFASKFDRSMPNLMASLMCSSEITKSVSISISKLTHAASEKIRQIFYKMII